MRSAVAACAVARRPGRRLPPMPCGHGVTHITGLEAVVDDLKEIVELIEEEEDVKK